ncbi:MAG: (d)CMP kinase [Desulfatitalea sp.]|nr:(d)CMP kinase [Desulfatitalea sp.]
MPSRPLIVTIDGPAGAGKTTVSKLLAKKLGYRYIDTGALYRGVAVAAREAGISAENDAGLEALCRRIKLDLIPDEDGLCILLNGAAITAQIRAPQISMLASAVSARPVVRAFLLATQRDLAARKAVVAEGRDMGTVVFPQAEAKFFLDADAGIRAQRRYEELDHKSGTTPSLTTVEQEMRQRDRNDSTRAVAPLQPAVDAIRIDSSRLSLTQVVDQMLRHIAKIA